MTILAEHWSAIQHGLFPFLSTALEEPLTAKLKQVISVLEVVRVEEHVPSPFALWYGRPIHDRRVLARAFVVKAVYDIATTDALIELLRFHKSLRRLCGWECRGALPSASTFSRAFAEFSSAGLGDRVLAALVSEHVEDKVVLHLSRDSTEVVARERVVRKVKPEKPPARKRGRPKKGEERPSPEPKRLDLQMNQSAEEALSDLPKVCDWGTKKDTGGHKHTWKGWKAHIDWADDHFPITVVTTSASVHDSQAAIPMARLTAEKVDSLYDLMDSAYDAPQIRKVSEDLGHTPIIEANPRRGGVPEDKLFDPATKRRYKERTTAERGNSRLKDEFGLRHLRVRGHAKAHLHIMLGVIVLFADQLLKPMSG